MNRAAEGLRVVEDYARLVLDDPHLTQMCKCLRHELAEAASAAAFGQADLLASRDTQHDVGTAISTAGEQAREESWEVCTASFKRIEQSLRSLEEYGKLADGSFSRRMEALRYECYTLEKAFHATGADQERLADVRLCVLVGGCGSTDEFKRLVLPLVGAGVGMIQLRDKQLDDRSLAARARRLCELTRGSRTLAIINDRPDIAVLARADGVHLGQDDLSVKDARAVVGPRMLIGVSTHSLEQAKAAVLNGADYIGAGPTFASSTKQFDELAGLDYLRAVSAEIRLPTFAIGGITADNLPAVLETGVTRAAVSSAVTQAANPAVAARELQALLLS